MNKFLYCRVTVGPPSPEDRRLDYRRKRYKLMMERRGLRPESIEKYLIRGFKGPFAKAMKNEMQRLLWDIKYYRERVA